MEEKAKDILFKLTGYQDFTLKNIHSDEEEHTYEEVFDVSRNGNHYIFKKTNSTELAFYKLRLKELPKIYASYKDGEDYYILIEKVKGNAVYKFSSYMIKPIIDAISSVQDKYWEKPVEGIDNFMSEYSSVIKRKEYLDDERYAKLIDELIEVYKNVPRSIASSDLLPFNVMFGEEGARLIDFGSGGFLPYPVMIARLLSHTSNDINYVFYISDKDKETAIKYYYDSFISKKGISYDEYIHDLRLFMFYECTEYIMVHEKYKDEMTPWLENEYKKALIDTEKVYNEIKENSLSK